MGCRGRARFPIVVMGATWVLLLLAWTPIATGITPYGVRNSFDGIKQSFISTSPFAAELSSDVTVSDYVVNIRPNYPLAVQSTTTFDGDVTFNFAVSRTSTSLKLSASSLLDIKSVAVKNGAASVTVSNLTRTENTMTLTTSRLTSSNVYTATIEFSGEIQTETHGFYKSTYKKENGDTGVLFTTHFQADHAREVFPCFDEPSYKATFQLSIVVPFGYNALSNTPVESTSEVESNTVKLTRITFHKTVPMSSYLLAFVVYETSSFVSSHVVISDNGTPIRAWARKDAVKSRLTDYSQDITFKILRELEYFTKIPYNRENMVKIDQVAVPDFGAGAMENWGLVIYRETRLFYDAQNDSEYTRKRVASIIAHELTHQWFGNLVTTKWWDTTWLNEGFARYFQYLILSKIYPNWRMMEQLLLDQQMTIFVEDSVYDAKSLNHDVTTSKEIKDKFDSITYSKGACIVRMMRYILGDDNFQEGLHTYLQRGTVSVTPENLFSDLSEYVPEGREDIPFDKAMETWTTQSGFPVLHVNRDYDTKTANISQYRFFRDGTVEKQATLYHVPIIWSSSEDSTQRFLWLSEQSTTLKRLPEIEYWILLHSIGYYRVNYDEGNWITLSWTLLNKRSRIAPVERAKLLDDVFALTHAGHLNYRVLGYFLRYLRQETDILPWAAADRGLKVLHVHLGNIVTDGTFYDYVRQATSAVYEDLNGFSKRGDPPELLLRGTVLNWACLAGNQNCLDESYRRLRQYLYENTPMDDNLKDVIMCHGTRTGTRLMWEDLWARYEKSEDSTERTSFLQALACTEDTKDLNAYLERVTGGLKGADPTESRTAFKAVLSHPKSVPIALNFILEKLPNMRLKISEETINLILFDLADHLSSKDQYLRISRFLEQQILNELIDEDFGDYLISLVKYNMENMDEFLDDVLKALKGATPEVSNEIEPSPTEAPGTSSSHQLIHHSTLLVMTLLLISFLQ